MKFKSVFFWGVLGTSVAVNLGLGAALLSRSSGGASARDGGPESTSQEGAAGPSAGETGPSVGETGPSAGETNRVETVPMEVVNFAYDGQRELRLLLSRPPEMADIRRYVSVSPLASGYVGFDRSTSYNWRTKKHDPVLVVTGDFAHRTNVTCVVRRGLTVAGKVGSATADEMLAEDAVYTFRRNDLRPEAAFVSKGRYLPPCGSRAIAISSVNKTNVVAEIRRVEPRNLVQLLAREEDVYANYYGGGGDSRDTQELAGEPTVFSHVCRNVPNVKEIWNLPVKVTDDGATNGVFLVSIRGGDWRSHRLVCVSDLALSVRRSGDNGCGVWVTSLTTGRPLAGAWVEVYSEKGIRVAEGRTDAQGWCASARVAPGEPFAVVVLAPEADDMTFLALSDRNEVDETPSDGVRGAYLAPKEIAGFAWTERGIYRHGEKILFQAILRDGTLKAPSPFPVRLELVSPKRTVYASTTAMSTEIGTVTYERFTVPDDQPSGVWKLLARLPGKDGRVLASTSVKVEEFAIPQVRVSVEPQTSVEGTNFVFDVSAEYLFGGPAQALRVEGAIVYEDAPFCPAGWTGYRFGNDDLGLEPNFASFEGGLLDEHGRARLVTARWKGQPKAMVKAIVQGVVFEDGGRPATARGSVLLHPAPFYIGTTLKDWVALGEGGREDLSAPRREVTPGTFHVACVTADGSRLAQAKHLTAKIERFEHLYAYQEREEGWTSWNADRIRVPVAENLPIEVPADGTATVTLPVTASGDYALTITDPETGVSFGRTFYLSDGDDDGVAAPLGNPTQVTIRTDKPFYRVGETPRLVVKAPFAGAALLTVLRDEEVYTEVLTLTNATSEVTLRPVRFADAPNLDVFLSVVQAVTTKNHLAVRAHGQVTVPVRPVDRELEVGVSAEVFGTRLEVGVAVAAPCGVVTAGPSAVATVTVVDEGINLLTGEKTPDPIGELGMVRGARHPLYDLYGRLLPVLDDGLKASGVKTGGGFGADLLGRVSPVGSRRFKPLVRWQREVPVVDGRARVAFDLPEFVGEVRVTAVVVSSEATGAASVQQKISPKLVMLPDAPRFVAPGDVFEAKLPLFNKSAAEGTVRAVVAGVTNELSLAAGASTNLAVRLTAPTEPGELSLAFVAEGLGETHASTLDLPVRPAVAWVETNGWERRETGTGAAVTTPRREVTPGTRYTEKVYESPMGAYAAALRWLGDYPHGCLEQTSSRIFPLVGAGTELASIVTNGADYVKAGVRRVESMVRENDFVMWPDCTYAPWTREVSLYAAHFLFTAERRGFALTPSVRTRVVSFLKKWTLDDDVEVSAYAALVGVLARVTDRDRLYRLYDDRTKLSSLARSRLALAFAELNDRPRATALLAGAYDPDTIKEAAFRLMALVACDPDDSRVLPLVAWLNAQRDKARLSWGTTEENAHALLAIGTYYQARPPRAGETFVAWRKLTLPKPAEVKDEAEGLFLDKAYYTTKGEMADLTKLACGQLIFAELTVTSAVTRVVNDLVIQDLFPAAFEPVHNGLCSQERDRLAPEDVRDWVMRFDARDDRMLVFSKKFTLEAGHVARFVYPVRVVSAGDFVLPGASVEGMYDPRLHARRAPGRLVVCP